MSQKNITSNNGGLLGSILRGLFAHEGASGTLWNLVYILIATGGAVILFAVGYAWFTGAFLFPILTGLLGSSLLVAGLVWKDVYLTDIPSDPPHLGILTIWGERLPFIEGEGDAMAGPGIEYTLVNTLACDYNFAYEVQCRATSETTDGATTKKSIGSRVKVKVSMTSFPDWNGDDPAPDPDRLIQYLNHNGREGVRNILEGMLGQGVRHEAGRHNAEEFTLMQDALSVALLVDIADVEFREVNVDERGKILDDIMEEGSTERVSPAKYKNLPQIVDPLRYLFPTDGEPIGTTEELRRQQTIKTFLKVAEQNGVSDIIDLGIRITRLNVESIEPEAAIREAAAKAEAELKERQAEMRDVETDIMLAKKYVEESGGNVSFDKALEIVRINRDRAKELIVRSSGNGLLDAAALLQGAKH